MKSSDPTATPRAWPGGAGQFLLLAVLLTVVGCGGSDAGPGTSASYRPPTGVGTVVDWEDSTKAVKLDGGWTVYACEGEGHLLCVERDGAVIGIVEAMAYPIGSFEGLDPSDDPAVNLERFVAGFVDALRADRAAGCGPGYQFVPLQAEDFALGGTPGIAFGFVGTLSNGEASELNLQYATIVDDQVISIVAIAYDAGGCPGRDDLSGFDSATLSEFRPRLEEVLHESPLPSLAETPVDIGY